MEFEIKCEGRVSWFSVQAQGGVIRLKSEFLSPKLCSFGFPTPGNRCKLLLMFDSMMEVKMLISNLS